MFENTPDVGSLLFEYTPEVWGVFCLSILLRCGESDVWIFSLFENTLEVRGV